MMHGTMVNVALPTMAKDFGVQASEVEWIAVGYLLAVATVIPAAGWLGDRFGTKRIFVLSLGTFTVVSLLCGAAQTLDQLVILRVLQGLGGGLMTPIGGAMLYRAFPMSQRASAATAVLSVAVIAPALGPMIGGILVDQASWRWIFLINIPIGGLGVVLAQRALREECAYALVDLDTPLTTIAGLSFVRGLSMGLVFVAIQTAVYATTSLPDTGRATSLFNTQRQISYASGVAVAATVLAASLGDLDDTAPAIERLAAHQHAFLAVGLVMIPGIVVSWFVRDDDVAETRGLAPVVAESRR